MDYEGFFTEYKKMFSPKFGKKIKKKMKIICIGKNYVSHAKEMGSTVPKEPLFFLKPDSAILPKNHPFFIPDFSREIHHEIELIIKIKKLGKHIKKGLHLVITVKLV